MKKLTNKGQDNISVITHKLNDTLMRSLERLDDDKNMNKRGYAEVERANAISKTSQAVINVIKTNMRIMEIADKQNKTTDEIRQELDK